MIMINHYVSEIMVISNFIEDRIFSGQEEFILKILPLPKGHIEKIFFESSFFFYFLYF